MGELQRVETVAGLSLLYENHQQRVFIKLQQLPFSIAMLFEQKTTEDQEENTKLGTNKIATNKRQQK